jgi:hypothetical protein
MTGGDCSTSLAARETSPTSTPKSASRRCCHRDAQQHLGTETAGFGSDVPAPSGHRRYFLVLGLCFCLPPQKKKSPASLSPPSSRTAEVEANGGRGGNGPLESPETLNQKPVSKSDHGFKRLCSAGSFQARGGVRGVAGNNGDAGELGTGARQYVAVLRQRRPGWLMRNKSSNKQVLKRE